MMNLASLLRKSGNDVHCQTQPSKDGVFRAIKFTWLTGMPSQSDVDIIREYTNNTPDSFFVDCDIELDNNVIHVYSQSWSEYQKRKRKEKKLIKRLENDTNFE